MTREEKLRLAKDPGTPGDVLARLYSEDQIYGEENNDLEIDTALAENPNLPLEIISDLVRAQRGFEDSLVVALAVAKNPVLPLLLLEDPGFFTELRMPSTRLFLGISRIAPSLLYAPFGHSRYSTSDWFQLYLHGTELDAAEVSLGGHTTFHPIPLESLLSQDRRQLKLVTVIGLTPKEVLAHEAEWWHLKGNLLINETGLCFDSGKKIYHAGSPVDWHRNDTLHLYGAEHPYDSFYLLNRAIRDILADQRTL